MYDCYEGIIHGINVREPFIFVVMYMIVPLYSFLYSGECSFHDLMSFTNNSYIPNYRKFFHEKPSERYQRARVFMLRETGTNEL